MLAMLEFFDLYWIAIIVAAVAWFTSLYSGAEARTRRVELKLDQILRHLGHDDDETSPP